MRALQINAPNEGYGKIAVATVCRPVPREGEVLVAISYGGLNFADLMMARGIYPHPKGYPLTPGIEASGTVAATGPGVTGFSEGDRVVAFIEDAGAFAEFCVIPARRLIKLPDGIGLDTAAAFCVQGLTAWHLLHTVSTTRPGDIILIHAIGGGVGLFLTQLAKQAGATVIGTVGTSGKEKRAIGFGADRVIHRDTVDFAEAVESICRGRGVDKVIDSTGASILDRSFDTLRPLGHVVSYGEAEGRPFANLWERLVPKSLTFTRFHIGHVDPRANAWQDGAAEVMARVVDGRIQVPVEATYDLEESADAYAQLASRRTSGKILIRVS